MKPPRDGDDGPLWGESATWTEDVPALSKDQVRPERYEERAPLGEGGLGRVTEVFDRVLTRQVARKVLVKERGTARQRFLREARLTAQLEHPNIVPVHDAGEDDDGRPFYIMKRIEGRSLQEAIDAADDLESRLQLVDHVVDACQAIAYAHSRGVLHRDIKPDNIMLGHFGETWVVDWGLAVADDPGSEGAEAGNVDAAADVLGSEESLTRVGAVVGTPAFMSPEQARGEAVDARSEVWSLGATLHAVVARRPPFQGGGPRAVLQRAATKQVRSVGDRVPELPRDLAAVIDRALSFRPEGRYPDAGALAEDLRRWQAGQRVRVYDYTLTELGGMAWRHHWPKLVAGALVSALVIGVGGLGVYGIERQRRQVRASYAALAVQHAGALYERDALAHAELLAAEALAIGESPEARGLLAATAAAKGAVMEWRSEAPGCTRIAVSSDGLAAICVGAEGTWAWVEDELAWTAGPGGGAAYAPDGRTVAVAHVERGVALHDAATGEVRERWEADGAHTVAWTPDGRALWVGVDDGRLYVDGRRAGDERVCAGSGMPISVASRVPRVAVGCLSGEVAILHSRTFEELDRHRVGELSYSVWLSPDGQTLLASARAAYDRVQLGAPGPADNRVERIDVPVDIGMVLDAVPGEDGSVLVSGQNGEIVLQDAEGRQVQRWSARHVPGVPARLGDRVWMSSEHGRLERWRVSPARQDRAQVDALEVVVAPERDRLLLVDEEAVHVLEISTLAEVSVVGPPEEGVGLASAGYVGDELAVVDRYGSWSLGPEGGPPRRTGRQERRRWSSLRAFTGDGQLVSLVPQGAGGGDGHVVLVERLGADAPPRRLDPEGGEVPLGLDSWNGQVLVRGDGMELLRVGTPADPTLPDDPLVSPVSGVHYAITDGHVGVLTWPDGRRARIEGLGVHHVAWAGERLVTGQADGTVEVWDVDTQTVIATLPGLTTRVGALVATEDVVIGAEWGPTVRRWSLAPLELEPGLLQERARERLGIPMDVQIDPDDWD